MIRNKNRLFARVGGSLSRCAYDGCCLHRQWCCPPFWTLYFADVWVGVVVESWRARFFADPDYDRWLILDSLVLQCPLGGVVFFSTLLTGYLSSRIPNMRLILLILLILCCLPVMAACAIIWRSSWTCRAAATVAGYTIFGLHGRVVSLVISIGMATIAGANKKSCTAVVILVASHLSQYNCGR